MSNQKLKQYIAKRALELVVAQRLAEAIGDQKLIDEADIRANELRAVLQVLDSGE